MSADSRFSFRQPRGDRQTHTHTHTHRGRGRLEMSIGTCWIPQVSQCAAVCLGARLILRLYAKFVLSNAQRRAPRPPPPGTRQTHVRAPRLICLRRQLIGQEWPESKLVDVVSAAHSCCKYCTLFFPHIFCLTGWQDYARHWHPRTGWTLMIQCISLKNYKAT